jgi:hypothetical protein
MNSIEAKDTTEQSRVTAITSGTKRFLHTMNANDFVWDYCSLALTNATTETYTFKTGGSGGTTVKTIVVVYTDDTKETLSTVTKT